MSRSFLVRTAPPRPALPRHAQAAQRHAQQEAASAFGQGSARLPMIGNDALTRDTRLEYLPLGSVEIPLLDGHTSCPYEELVAVDVDLRARRQRELLADYTGQAAPRAVGHLQGLLRPGNYPRAAHDSPILRGQCLTPWAVKSGLTVQIFGVGNNHPVAIAVWALVFGTRR